MPVVNVKAKSISKRQLLGEVKDGGSGQVVGVEGIHQVKVSSEDTQSNYLANKIKVERGLTETVIEEDGEQFEYLGMPEANENDTLRYNGNEWESNSIITIQDNENAQEIQQNTTQVYTDGNCSNAIVVYTNSELNKGGAIQITSEYYVNPNTYKSLLEIASGYANGNYYSYYKILTDDLRILDKDGNLNGSIGQFLMLVNEDGKAEWSDLIASLNKTDVSNFDNLLSSSDDTVQKALDTLDDHTHAGLLPEGNNNETLRNNSGEWITDDTLQNDGTDLYFNISNKVIGNIIRCADANGKVEWTPPNMIGVPQATYKTADETVINSTTFQNDDHLSFSAASNGKYIVNINLMITQADAGSSFKFKFTVPSGCVCRGSYNMFLGTGISTGVLSGVDMDLTASQELFMGAVNNYLIQINMMVDNSSTQGTVQLQWAQLYANPFNTILKKYSNMIINKIV